MLGLAVWLSPIKCFLRRKDIGMGKDQPATDVLAKCKITFSSSLDGKKPRARCKLPLTVPDWLLFFAAGDTIAVQRWWKPLPLMLRSMSLLSAMGCTTQWPYFACAFNLLLSPLPPPQSPASQLQSHPPLPPGLGHLGIHRGYTTLRLRIRGSAKPTS